MIASDLNFNVCRLHTGHFERLYSDIIAMTTGSRTNVSTIRIGSHNGASSPSKSSVTPRSSSLPVSLLSTASMPATMPAE